MANFTVGEKAGYCVDSLGANMIKRSDSLKAFHFRSLVDICLEWLHKKETFRSDDCSCHKEEAVKVHC